jgi:hypothetical protein
LTFQQKVLYLLFLMFFGVGAAEVISIVLFPDPLGLFRDSEKLGYEMNPNFDGSHGKLTEFRTRITTNSKGLRDREYGGERSDKPLILTLGDSVTFGWGVELDETYPKQLERLFKGSVDVVNAGVWGYNTLQEIEYVKSGASGYRPDLVMVGFTSPITVQRNWYSAQVGRITVEPLYNPATGLAGRVRAVLKNNSNLFSFLERRWAYQGRILPSFLDFRRMGEAAGQEKTAEAPVSDDIVPGTLPDECRSTRPSNTRRHFCASCVAPAASWARPCSS